MEKLVPSTAREMCDYTYARGSRLAGTQEERLTFNCVIL